MSRNLLKHHADDVTMPVPMVAGLTKVVGITPIAPAPDSLACLACE